MTREQALKILEELRNSPNMVKHALACEAAMRTLAQKFEPEKINDWRIVGLLHDADYEATNKDLETHTDLVCEKLTNLGVEPLIIAAIKGHCDKAQRETLMAKAVYAADELTGLIVATALVMPGKKLSEVTVESVLKKFKEPRFAAGANRAQIKTCETELDIPLAEFVEIVLKSMQEISTDLGL